MRKKRFSKKARAAAMKNLRKAQRARRRGKRRSHAREGAAMERKRPRRKGARRRKGAKRRSSPRRRTAKRRTRRSGPRRKYKSRKRSAAAKKGARTRKRRLESQYDSGWSGGDPDSYGERRRPRRRKAKRRRKKNPVGVSGVTERRRRRRRKKNPVAATESRRRRRGRRSKGRRHQRRRGLHYTSKRTGRRRTRRMRGNDARRGWDRRRGRRIRRNPVAKERRRHRRHNPHRRHGRRRRNPIANPIGGMMEFIGGVAGVGVGFGLASLVDRVIITHAYTSGQDAPAQGTIYNSEVMMTPIWMNYKRMLGALGAIAAPLFVARFVHGPGAKAFLQLAGFGALGRTAGKAVDDLVASTMTSNTHVQQLYAGEIAATAKLNAANLSALSPAPPATFAGIPNRQLNPARFVGSSAQPHGTFSNLPARAGGLGSSTPDEEEYARSRNTLPVPNLAQPQVQPNMSINQPRVMAGQPPVPASTSLFIPALCNPDDQS